MDDSNIGAYNKARHVMDRLLREAARYGAGTVPLKVSVSGDDVPCHITLLYDGEMPVRDVQAWQLATGQAWEVHTQPSPMVRYGFLRTVHLTIGGVKILLLIVGSDMARAERTGVAW